MSNSNNNNLDDERIKQQRREEAARRRAAKQQAQARQQTEAAQQSQPRRRQQQAAGSDATNAQRTQRSQTNAANQQQPAARKQAANGKQRAQRQQDGAAGSQKRSQGSQQSAARKQASAQGQQPVGNRQQSAGNRQPATRKQSAKRQQPATKRAQQPATARVQQPAAARQQPRQRNSVRAESDRQQQRSQQQQVRQQQRTQQQQAHRQQMREQTMREHQQRMQQQRNQYGKGAYSAESYAGRGGATRAAVVNAGVHTQAPQNLNESMEQAQRKRRRRNIIIAVIAAVVIVLGGATAAFAMSAKGAKDNAQELMTQGQNLITQVKAGDMTGAQATASNFASTAKELHDTTSSPLWAAATVIPVYGGDIAQVRTIAEVADTLSQQVLVPVVKGLPTEGLASIVVGNGVNVQALQDLLVPLGASSDSIHECAQKIDSLGEVHLDQLKNPVSTIKSALSALDAVSAQATEISNVLPGMLGVNEPRNYLLIAANNAEIRSTGGMAGSFGLMTVTNGQIQVGDFAGADVAPSLTDEVVMDCTDEEEQIFGNRVAYDIRDSCFIPNFARAAQFERHIWEANNNPAVAGVVMLDPVFLQRILAITGPVTTSDGTVVDGNNCAQMLMNEVYIKYGDNNAAEDLFFADVANQAMHNIFNNLGGADLTGFLTTVTKSFEDRRFYAWMVDDREQAVLKSFGATGETPTSETEPVTGVYLSAAIGGKIFWYLDADTTVGPGTKNSDGSTSYNVTLTLNNTLSEELASTLGWYITGELQYKRSASDMTLDVYLFAPAGGKISNVESHGYFYGPDKFTSPWDTHPLTEGMTEASYNGQNVWYGVTGINGDSGTTITYTVTTSPKATEELKVDQTPPANESL